MGGRIPYGFQLKNTVIDGIKTSMYEPIPEEIEVVKLIYSLYSDPQTSFSDVMRYLFNHGIRNRDGEAFSRSRIRDVIVNPIYLKADDTIYEFFQSQGAVVINDISQFIGTNGVYLYTGEDADKRKSISLNGHVVVLAPHEGCINSALWLQCRKKCLNVRQIAKPIKAKNTWLAGKIKCRKCGYALSLRENIRKRTENARYYVCARKYVAMTCDGIGAVSAEKIEDIVFLEMQKKLAEFNELQMHEKREDSLEVTKKKVRVDQIENEIKILVERILSANAATMEYINRKIEELDTEKTALKREIAEMSADIYGRKDVGAVKGYLQQWDKISISDKLVVVDTLIDTIKVDGERVEITWKI